MRGPNQHGGDMAMPQRRRCVEPPNLAVNRFDLTYEVSDLQNWLDHTIQLFGEPVPFGRNALVLGLQTTICFDRPQGLDPLGELLPGFVQTIPRERSVLHLATRKLQVIA